MKVLRIIIVVLAVLFFLGLVLVLLSLPDAVPEKRSHRNETIRLATANIQYSNAEADRVARRLASLDLDLLIVLECTGQNVDLHVLQEVGLISVLKHPHPGTHGMCILAREELFEPEL